jgi:hypothetical protein
MALANSATAPTPAGGTVAAGAYSLSAVTIYGCGAGGIVSASFSASASLTVTSATTGGFALDSTQVENNTTTNTNATGSYTTSADYMILDAACPAVGLIGEFGYTVNGSELLLIATNTGDCAGGGQGTEVLTFDLQ